MITEARFEIVYYHAIRIMTACKICNPDFFFAQDMVDQVLRHTLGHDVVTNSLRYIGSTHLLYNIYHPRFCCV